MFGDSPFLGRVILLLSLMALFGAWDRWRNGAKATRFQEYGFILAAKVLMFGDSPFLGRVILLLSLMALFGAWDRWRNGAKATRFQEYGFILAGGLLGSIVGACNDWITAGISPEYFTLGKGLEDENVRTEAMLLGLKTGFSAGIIGGAVALFAIGRARGPWRDLYLRLWMPVAGAIACALTVPLIAGRSDPMRLLEVFTQIVLSEAADKALKVWWIHTGLYAGLLIGLAGMIFDARKRRR